MSPSVHAELSSLADSAGTLRERVSGLLPMLSSDRDADLLTTLVEVERALATAARRLERAKRLTV
jgi:hypothetical protein